MCHQSRKLTRPWAILLVLYTTDRFGMPKQHWLMNHNMQNYMIMSISPTFWKKKRHKHVYTYYCSCSSPGSHHTRIEKQTNNSPTIHETHVSKKQTLFCTIAWSDLTTIYNNTIYLLKKMNSIKEARARHKQTTSPKKGSPWKNKKRNNKSPLEKHVSLGYISQKNNSTHIRSHQQSSAQNALPAIFPHHPRSGLSPPVLQRNNGGVTCEGFGRSRVIFDKENANRVASLV